MKNNYENPEIQSINRLPMRSNLIPYADPSQAISETALGPESLDFTKSSFVKLLDGEWDFVLLKNPSENENAPDLKWSRIKVPGTWSLQGFDHPHYTNVQMPFDTIPPFVPEENPTGIYKSKVSVPEGWKNRRIVLHVGSAESVLEVFIDGKSVGLSKDTRLPSEFDITNQVSGKAEFELKLKVIRYSDASFVEDQDQWWFGGIHRSVYLYSTENHYIADIEALTKFEDAGNVVAADCDPIHNAFHEDKDAPSYKEGSAGIIPLYVTLGYTCQDSLVQGVHSSPKNAELDNHGVVIKYSVYELKGTVQKGEIGAEVASGEASGKYNLRQTLNQVRIKIRLEKPKLWSHEEPNLYVVNVSLCEAVDGKAGRIIETTAFTTGFKSVQIKNRELRINGKKIFIKGVNRHEHNEYHGKTLSTAEMIKDLHIMKSYNFNAVRTCHYPDDERWYELCNRYGMYVLDEANIENHAYYDVIARSDAWTNAYMQRIQRMIRRDKNNVCIFGWSLGNESGDGQNQVAASAWIRRVDHTRLVHYEGFVRPPYTQADFTLDGLARGKGLSDFIGPMYPSIDLITEYAKTRNDYRPIIMCEYSHAMGNANGSLADYWRKIYSVPGLQGGFIWDWIDQGIAAEEPEGKSGKPQGGKYWKYGGDFGDTPTDYDFCLNGIMFPDQSPKPAMEECRKVFSPVQLVTMDLMNGKFSVRNHFKFISIGIDLNWKILKNGKPVEQGSQVMFFGQNQKEQIVHLPVAEYVSKTDANYVLNVEFSYDKDNFYAQKGWVLGRDEIELGHSDKADLVYCSIPGASSQCPDRILGMLKTAEPEIFRPLTENECIKRELPNINNVVTPWAFMNKPTKAWINAGLPDAVTEKDSNGGFEIFTGNDGEKKLLAKGKISYTKTESPFHTEAVKLTAEIELTDALPEYPKAGISLKVPSQFKDVTWYGRGPEECYSDRKDGAMLGLYNRNADSLEVPYIVPQENGSRCDTTYLCLSDGQKEMHVQSAVPFTFNYTPYTYSDLWKCQHHNEMVNTSKGEKGFYTLHLDASLRGVGTGACGPDTLDKYRVKPGKYKLEIILY